MAKTLIRESANNVVMDEVEDSLERIRADKGIAGASPAIGNATITATIKDAAGVVVDTFSLTLIAGGTNTYSGLTDPAATWPAAGSKVKVEFDATAPGGLDVLEIDEFEIVERT